MANDINKLKLLETGINETKVDTKKFGDHDVQTWLTLHEQHFMLHQVPWDKGILDNKIFNSHNS